MRARGEGSIFRRGDGLWAGQIDLGWEGGRRIRKTVYGQTQDEVVKAMAKLRREKELGMVSRARAQSIQQFLTGWVESVQVRPGTLDRYKYYVRYHLIPDLGRIQLERLTPDHVNAMLRRKAKTLSPRTCHHLRSVLRNALNRALRYGLITRNVAALADPPRVPKFKPRYLAQDEAMGFLRAAEGERLEALFSVALPLGIREGEALGLKWSDINWETGHIRIERAMQRVNSKLQFVEPKTEESRRVLKLPALSIRALKEHRTRQNLERLAAGDKWHDWDLIFSTAEGRPLSGSFIVNHPFRRILRRAGLPVTDRKNGVQGVRFHDLRHSAASLLLAQGVPLKVVSEILGHTRIGTTADIYGHLAQEVRDQLADAMNQALGS